MSESDRPPERLADVVSRFLRQSGLGERIKQSSALDDWPELVGPDIAAVTQPVSISQDGTLLVAVRNHAWMNELTMMERELLESVNRVTGARPIVGLRWVLMR
jgi:predicted nucleic acid-binding Zn ribbon protein